jgi:hypothetical protein
MTSDLRDRFQSLHREMVEQFERTAAVEHHWLIYALLGWEHLLACCASHYLLQVKRFQEPRSLYVIIWLVQILVTWATIHCIASRPRLNESPLEPLNKRIWTIFIFLCINVAVLNVVSGEPIFAFMPVLATLSSFAFSFVTTFISRRFMAAGLTMFVTGMLMARFRTYEFLIYGVGWLIVLETLSLTLWLRRGRWIDTTPKQVALGSQQRGHQSGELIGTGAARHYT